ncbi:MAG: dimethylsulfonioproprionate lyase family protein [Granulosicoccus sp.]
MISAKHNPISSLLACAASTFSSHKSQMGVDASEALLQACTQPLVKTSHTVDQCKQLPKAYKQQDSLLNREIEKLETTLHWNDTGAAAKGDNIQQHLAFVELLGPTGMTLNDHCRVGLFFQNAHAEYPMHRHAAQELYFVISGTALWKQSDSDFTPKPTGSFIHHASWKPHGTTTISEPMLAMWCWTGDVGFDTYEII